MVMSALPNSPSPVDLGAFQLGNLGADVGAPLDQKIVGDRPPHPICFSTVVLCSIGGVWEYGAVPKRRIIVNLATSADGYIARPDGNLDWLTSRPIPKGFYGLGTFSRSVDA
jgi:hypothetical protein